MAVRIADYEAYTFNMCADCGTANITWKTVKDVHAPFCEECPFTVAILADWSQQAAVAKIYKVYVIPG